MATKMTYDNLACELGRVALSRDNLRFELHDVKVDRDTYRDLCGELLEELRETHAGLCFTKDYIGTLRYDRNKSAIIRAESVMGENSNG